MRLAADRSNVHRERTVAVAGVLAPVVALGAVALAIAASPTFAWTESALSDLGRAGGSTATTFNGGLLAGGLLSLPFAVGLWRGAGRSGLRRLGAVLFALTGLSLAAVGVFPAGRPLHVEVSVAFFVGLTLTLWAHGAGDVRAGAPRWGAFGLALGSVNPLGWLAWLGLARDAVGVAVPEAVGAVAFGLWTVATAARRFRSLAAARSEGPGTAGR